MKIKHIIIGIKNNLCEYCQKEFATCDCDEVKYGEGIGYDNVIQCDAFVSDGTPEAIKKVIMIADDMEDEK